MLQPRRLFLKRLACLLPAIFVGSQVTGCDRGSGSSGATPAGTATTGAATGTTATGSSTSPATGGSTPPATGGTTSPAGGTPTANPPPVNTPFQVGTQFFAANQFQQALDALTDGGTLLIRGGASYNVTGTLARNGVTLKGVGGKATLDGLMNPSFPAQGKGLIVQQGSAATYEDLIFRNVAVPDQNGVGVRLEGGGTTTFRRCEFRDSQEGILTDNESNIAVVMEDCIGDNLGAGDGFSHGVYCGTIGSFTVTGGSWTNSNVGHLLKSRAARTHIENVVLTEGRASRAVDVPNGGVVEILGCTISQSQDTNNPEIIGYGFEVGSAFWPTNSFTFRASNVVTDTRSPHGSVFSFAGWFSSGAKVIERYTYNGSTANPPGFTG